MSALDPTSDAGVAQVARLARLALSPEEARAAREHLGRVLAWVAELEALDTSGVAPAPEEAALAALRADVVEPSLSPEEALANAPERGAAGFLVPAVLSGGE